MDTDVLYNPFEDFRFDNETCFLSGQPLQSAEEQIPVFPDWLMRKFDIEDKPFKLLDGSHCTYKQLQLPCTAAVADRFSDLDERVENAFEKGYEEVMELDRITLFQWVARIVYGVVFNEIQVGVHQQLLSGEAMNFSQVLVHKFKNLHLMLQSLIKPVQFDGTPFTMVVVQVDNPADTFNYRDEINTLVYSLRMNDFGLIACLQDNGANGAYHEAFVVPLTGRRLHPIQFEELCARFFYSAYLFNRLPTYTVMPTAEQIYIEPMPLMDMSMKPIFDPWQVKTYGQVLENFWKPWGYTLFEIIKDPENPMSFLSDEHGKPIDAAEIALANG
ncbi:hypothetical protein [Parapedobacter sp. 10938]|uniref:hypothetical protein n=1 Tax=Parapedobacter flavus TaxID=3110225 RepID=UPI002DBE69C3|nr:hypothetical protein [Parapedobacter sp. 10938]MEC3881580.1 hypothetical protein [Parapedobacter sp. 10938]